MSWMDVNGAGWTWLHGLVIPVRVSKTMCEFLHFNSVSFLLKFMFLFNKMHGLLDFKAL